MDPTDKAVAVKMGAAATAASMAWLGIGLSDWVLIATLAYFTLQCGLLVPKYLALVARWWNRRSK